MEKEALIFDFDGVINDSGKPGCERIIEIVRRDCHRVPNNIWERFTGIWDSNGVQVKEGAWGHPGVEMMTMAFDLDPETAGFLYKEWERIDATSFFPLVDGAAEILEVLRSSGFNICMLTSRNRDNLFKVLEYHDILRFFDHIQARDDWSFRKPDPHAFCLLLDKLKKNSDISIEECIYVGDTPEDLKAARDRGIENVSVLSGIFTREQFIALGQKPENILLSIKYLPGWLNSFGEAI
ncbi:MAG: HAD family hydrolase [Parcubacteria group bacterium]|nr:HAD family hydrolase [Parcubacteria group bacterium]